MIKASELRIGNLVSTFGTNGNPNGWSEVSIDLHQLDACIQRNDIFKGLPITEEWLLKFGFEKINHEWRDRSISNDLFIISYLGIKYFIDFTNYGIALGRIESNNTSINIPFGGIKYIHQLQNLYFALTNEELTIKEKAEIA